LEGIKQEEHYEAIKNAGLTEEAFSQIIKLDMKELLQELASLTIALTHQGQQSLFLGLMNHIPKLKEELGMYMI